MSLYVFFNEELVSINITHNRDKINFILKMLNELVDSWRKIASSTANAPAAKIENVLNITG